MHAILAARSHFSIGESILTVERLVDAAVKVGATSVALTDTMSVTGLIELTNVAKKKSVKPVVGCRLRIVDDPTWRKTKDDKKAPPEYFVTWYVLSEKGLLALFKLLSLGNSEERFYNVPKVSFDDLYAALQDVCSDDVIIATSDVYSVIHHKRASEILRRIVDALDASSVLVTLTPIDSPYWDAINVRALKLAEELNLGTIVTVPTFYDRGDADAAEIMNAVSRNVKLDSLWHNSNYVRTFHPLGLKELAAACIEAKKRLETQRGLSTNRFLEGLKATQALVDRVKYEWTKAPVSLPKMADDEIKAVVDACKVGWAQRFVGPVFAHKPSKEELVEVYRPRLLYELQVLKDLGFSGYFLLVQDVVNFAKSNGILVGPGRGSVGGSLVAYLMGITDCDPIRFNLLFERFINPERIDLPDADLDFMSERRHEVVEYLVKKYGSERVAGVSNYGKLASSSAIRDVSRVFGLSEDDMRCSKFVPKEHGQPVKLEVAAEQVADIAKFRDEFRPIWDKAVKLEGVMRNMSQHAAGVVVGGCDLIERAVVERRSGQSVVCWDKRIVEDQGLVKMDILGLSTLDLIKKALDYIRKRHSKKVDLMRIALDDPKILDNFAKGLTTGVFQFESGGMKRLLRDLGADGTITFEDVTAATALYRPGPMDAGMMDSYVRRKQGKELVEYEHPLMQETLKPTYGVIVYQEQVMQISRDIAGYTMPQADKLRKIMGKKLPEEMKKERGKFVEGCIKTVNMTEREAGDLFDKIEKFAGYGFNRSHSVEYSLISYQSMWLKTYFPVEFFAAALSLLAEDRLAALLKDAERFGIEVGMPDINHSTGQFEIVTDTRLCIPFNRVKGISDLTTEAILKARQAGAFKSMDDLRTRVERRRCNVKHVELLNKVGAFSRIEPGQLPAAHPDRIKDQRDLLPGLVSAHVPIARAMKIDPYQKVMIAGIVFDYSEGHDDDGKPVRPVVGRSARFMVITDCPTSAEEREGKMSYGKSFEAVQKALGESDMSRSDAYWTALIKRPKEGKQVSAKEIATYAPYLVREIDVLKPPVIVLLGSTVVRHFIPGFKGKASEVAGEVIYSKELDANLVIGFSPGEIYHAPEKQASMNEVFASAQSLID